MNYDVIVIGAGLSGLTAASLLAKRGLRVLVAEKNADPGGSCGIFKRENAIFDQGAAMLYGFGERGFNAHRFLFNCLEEPFEVIRHEILYTIIWRGKRLRFFTDIDEFTKELSEVFPQEAKNIRRFYSDMLRLYNNAIANSPNYTTPDEMNGKSALGGVLRHPFSYIKLASLMNISAEKLLKKYFRSEEIFNFFDKLTSTYCYATVAEAPAVMAAVMFVDNHVGGSYYPAGSTLYLPGKLEKVIEEKGGELLYNCGVKEFIFSDGLPSGVRTMDNREFYADHFIYSGNVWQLYSSLLPDIHVSDNRRKWALDQIPTYPSLVFYALVDSKFIPEETSPIEMLISKENCIDEGEITVYIMSLDDKTLCDENKHTLVAIGPSLREWSEDKIVYEEQKAEECRRIIERLEKHFPGIEGGIYHSELATPKTLERFAGKYKGAVAGPKQMIGQHMLKRMHTKSEWENLFCCGESTVMGTGTPTVTVSGIAAANALLKKRGLEGFYRKSGGENYVSILSPPFEGVPYALHHTEEESHCINLAKGCQFCLSPSCCGKEELDIRGIMRRVSVGNFFGARRILERAKQEHKSAEYLANCDKNCILNKKAPQKRHISEVTAFLSSEQTTAQPL